MFVLNMTFLNILNLRFLNVPDTSCPTSCRTASGTPTRLGSDDRRVQRPRRWQGSLGISHPEDGRSPKAWRIRLRSVSGA